MEHLSGIEIIEYVAGNSTGPRTLDVRKHIAECPQCAKHVEQAQKLSNALGVWIVETAGHELADRVAALAQEAKDSKTAAARELIVRFMPQAMRVAASIIIAIGLGYKLGEYSVEERKSQLAYSAEKPKYVAALGLEWSSGLARLVLEEPPAETGAEQ
jgi:anti-sigma factor RsiW